MDYDNASGKRLNRFLLGANNQVLFEVGDEVVFRAGGRGILVGTVEKLNPKRARVMCGADTWAVPYGGLMLVCQATADKRYERGRRLLQVADEARELMNKHGLRDWSLEFNRTRRQLGACEWATKRIFLSRKHAVQKPPELVTDVILHEIAHALAGPEAGHGPEWKAIAIRLGARPRSCAPEPEETRTRRLASRASVRVGDKVTFEGKKRARTGVVLRKNPKTAKVKCSDSIWLVPYTRLEVLRQGASDAKGV